MYCATDDLIKRFSLEELIRLTDKDGTYNDVVTEVVEQAITDASGTIDGYLAGQYPLPLSDVPDMLNRVCADIARYYLYDDVVDEAHQASVRYKDAIKYLNNVSLGKIKLTLATSGVQHSNNTVEFSSAGSVFERSSSKGFI